MGWVLTNTHFVVYTWINQFERGIGIVLVQQTLEIISKSLGNPTVSSLVLSSSLTP